MLGVFATEAAAKEYAKRVHDHLGRGGDYEPRVFPVPEVGFAKALEDIDTDRVIGM